MLRISALQIRRCRRRVPQQRDAVDITPARVAVPGKLLHRGFLRQEKGAGCAVCNKPCCTGTFHKAKVHRDLEHPEVLREARVTKTQLWDRSSSSTGRGALDAGPDAVKATGCAFNAYSPTAASGKNLSTPEKEYTSRKGAWFGCKG